MMEEKPARTRRSFTDEFKRDAVAMVLDEGHKIVAASGSVRARWGTGWPRPARTGANASG